jgi:hypothetical protein
MGLTPGATKQILTLNLSTNNGVPRGTLTNQLKHATCQPAIRPRQTTQSSVVPPPFMLRQPVRTPYHPTTSSDDVSVPHVTLSVVTRVTSVLAQPYVQTSISACHVSHSDAATCHLYGPTTCHLLELPRQLYGHDTSVVRS